MIDADESTMMIIGEAGRGLLGPEGVCRPLWACMAQRATYGPLLMVMMMMMAHGHDH